MVMVYEWFDLKTTRTDFVGLTSKPIVTVSGGLTSRPTATVSRGLTSKPSAMIFSSLASKLVATVSPSLASKPVVSFLIELQNQVGGVFFDLDIKTATLVW
jgi:hypothetical protein